jgi:hypothetical protein
MVTGSGLIQEMFITNLTVIEMRFLKYIRAAVIMIVGHYWMII